MANIIADLPPLRGFDDDFDPFAAEDVAYGTTRDIHTPLAAMREKGPIHEIDPLILLGWQANPMFAGRRQFTVFRHDLVDEVSNDPFTFSVDANEGGMGETFGQSLSLLNPPDHGLIRRVFQKAFFPNVVAKWGENVISPVIHGLIDRFIDRGEAEMVSEFTHHYPFQIIFRQLDLPERDIETFHKLAASLTQTYGDCLRYGQEASRKLGVYFRDMIEARRSHPGEDLVSYLVNCEVDGEYIPEEIMVSFLRQLLNAAGDTTFRATGTMLIGLLRNPDQLDAVRADRALVPNAVEEAIRWDGPSPLQYRAATRDVTLGGIDIPAGSILSLALPACNRDPSLHRDPDKFDIFRKRSRHYGFSTGPHICLGQHLARLEMSQALNAILDRLTDIRIDPDKPESWISGIYFRTPHDVHVRFG